MNKFKFIFFLSLATLVLQGCNDDPEREIISSSFSIKEVKIDGTLTALNTFTGVNPESPIEIEFTESIDTATVGSNVQLFKLLGNDLAPMDMQITYPNGAKSMVIVPEEPFSTFSSYQINIWHNLLSTSGVLINSGRGISIVTTIDSTDKFTRIPDENLLDSVQYRTFNYFWEGGHPTSGMARERNVSEHTVTTGGTGFGVMAMVAAANRGFITRQAAAERVLKITDFLAKKCTTYHGAFSHWIDGSTGKTQPFSEKDDAADLIETSLLMQGLLTARQYFNGANTTEAQLRNEITALWEAVEWNWFTKGGEDVLYWHWSPKHEWAVNLPIEGWNESLITYVLAASSPTYPISASVYEKGWARNGKMKNGKEYYNMILPLGNDYGGPLFFAHYSFLGINPKGLTDQYANYWEQVRNHTLIHYEYCKANPNKFYGYSADCWGLTASDGNQGYSAHSPTNDKGVIAPTAALSSMPYTPDESMAALRFYYYQLGNKTWKKYGFVDAFNLSANWFDDQFVAIDQGPIVVMIENHRTGLLWDTFMGCQEVKDGMKNLGFQSPYF